MTHQPRQQAEFHEFLSLIQFLDEATVWHRHDKTSLQIHLINNHGEKMNINELQERFEFFLHDAHLPFSTLHKLRHSFAQLWQKAGRKF